MQKIRNYLTAGLLVALLATATYTDVLGLNFIRNFNVEDGLPSSEVYSVYQDADGYLWFCTDRGVAKYDGYNFRNFSTEDGLSYNTVFRVIEDPDKNLWFPAFDGTLSYWDPGKQKFIGFNDNEDLQRVMGPYNWPHILEFRGDSMLIYPYMYKKVYLSIKGRKGITELDIADYPPNRGRPVSPASSLVDQYAISSSTDRQPHFEIVRSTDRLLSPAEISVIEKKFNELEGGPLVTDIYCFEGKFAISSHEGVRIYQGDKLLSFSLEGNNVTGMLQDNEDNLWITTSNKGVFLARLDDIRSLRSNNMLEDGEKITDVVNFQEHILIGTSNGKIIDYTGKRVLSQLRTRSQIYSLHVDNDTLYASYGTMITGENGILKVHHVQEWLNRYLLIPMSGNDMFYTGHNRYGFIHGDSVANKPGRILDAHRLDNGSLYFSKFTGLWEIRGNDMSNVINLAPKLGIENTTVRKIYDIHDSVLVLATSGSGVVVVRDGKTIRRITTRHGLVSNMVNACYVDEEYGRIWCCTNRGVSVFNYTMENGTFVVSNVVNLNKFHGIVSNFITGAFAAGNSVILVGEKDMSSIPRDFRLGAVEPPKVNILSFISNDTNYYPGRTQFSHREDDFEVFYNAFSMQKPLDGYFYRYRLLTSERSDTTWTYTNDRGVWFKDLPSGSYVFEVSAQSLNSAWSEPKVIAFSIAPFFLDRLWVRLSLGLLVATMIILLIRRYIHQMRYENQKALEIKNLQLKNNQLELAALRGQMNPHFIFNALKSIQKLILAEQKWEANNLLTKFSKLIRASLEYSRTDFIPLKTEVEFLKNYLEIEQSRNPDKFNYNIDLTNVSDLEEIKIPGLLIQPICENAIKHAFQDGAGGNLEIIFEQDRSDGIIIKVKDDGIGYLNTTPRNSVTQHSMGLDIVRSRLALFNDQGYDAWLNIAPLDVQTRRGTIVTFKLPSQ